MTGDAATAYAKEVVAADFEEAGDDDVLRKVLGDLTAKGVAITEAAASRQDGRTDGAGRRPGEGGNVTPSVIAGDCEAANQIGTRDSRCAIAHLTV